MVAVASSDALVGNRAMRIGAMGRLAAFRIPQSGLTPSFSSGPNNWLMIADALSMTGGAVAPAPAPVLMAVRC
jgi:hypothetical protein